MVIANRIFQKITAIRQLNMDLCPAQMALAQIFNDPAASNEITLEIAAALKDRAWSLSNMPCQGDTQIRFIMGHEMKRRRHPDR